MDCVCAKGLWGTLEAEGRAVGVPSCDEVRTMVPWILGARLREACTSSVLEAEPEAETNEATPYPFSSSLLVLLRGSCRVLTEETVLMEETGGEVGGGGG